MTDDAVRVDAGDPAHEGKEAVPQRERVARMQAAVLEFVDGTQMQVAECDELAHAGFVEEAVAEDDTFHVPEKPAEHDAHRPGPAASEPLGGAAPTAAQDECRDPE